MPRYSVYADYNPAVTAQLNNTLLSHSSGLGYFYPQQATIQQDWTRNDYQQQYAAQQQQQRGSALQYAADPSAQERYTLQFSCVIKFCNPGSTKEWTSLRQSIRGSAPTSPCWQRPRRISSRTPMPWTLKDPNERFHIETPRLWSRSCKSILPYFSYLGVLYCSMTQPPIQFFQSFEIFYGLCFSSSRRSYLSPFTLTRVFSQPE